MRTKFDLIEEVVIQYNLDYDESIEDREQYIKDKWNGNPWQAMAEDPLVHDVYHDQIVDYIDQNLETIQYV